MNSQQTLPTSTLLLGRAGTTPNAESLGIEGLGLEDTPPEKQELKSGLPLVRQPADQATGSHLPFVGSMPCKGPEKKWLPGTAGLLQGLLHLSVTGPRKKVVPGDAHKASGMVQPRQLSKGFALAEDRGGLLLGDSGKLATGFGLGEE